MKRGNSSLPGRIRLLIAPEKDDYCYMCDDGGKLVVCTTCHRAVCYDFHAGTELDSTPNPSDQELLASLTATHSSCVTLPSNFFDNKHRVFQCPECLANTHGLEINYLINRGSRSTRRVSFRATVVIVVWYLRSLKVFAEATLAQLCATLGVFEIDVIQHLVKLPRQLRPEVVTEILDLKEPYHLAVFIITESDPSGGWWWSDNEDSGGKQQCEEEKLLEITLPLKPAAEKAVSARIYGIMCGINLANRGPIENLHKYLLSEGRHWSSLTIPLAGTVLPQEYAGFLPDFFVHAHYYGASFLSSLLRAWAKARRTRVHTGLLVMARASASSELLVNRFLFATEGTRPLGVDLPVAATVCGCSGVRSEWKQVHTHDRFGERFIYLCSTCCRAEFQVTVYQGPRRLARMHGMSVAIESWDPVTGLFPFNPFYMVAMRASIARSKAERDRDGHHGPWTTAAKQDT